MQNFRKRSYDTFFYLFMGTNHPASASASRGGCLCVFLRDPGKILPTNKPAVQDDDREGEKKKLRRKTHTSFFMTYASEGALKNYFPTFVVSGGWYKDEDWDEKTHTHLHKKFRYKGRMAGWLILPRRDDVTDVIENGRDT